jgi:Ser/Thr protein kinase RdoA (MazF antagonist)
MSDFLEVESVRRMARLLGFGEVEPRLLAVSEHVTLHLFPAPVVARVKKGAGAETAMRRELDVMRHLAERGAPVVRPLAEAGPYVENGFVLTLWPFLVLEPADGENERHQILAAESLKQVHGAFADYPGHLPGFERKIEACSLLLLTEPPALAAEDCLFLLSVHDEIAAALADPALERVPIHGDAGFHNLFLTEAGPLWSDFEAACLGPRAWDFAALGYGGDTLMAMARSFCVSVWCWAQAELPGKREAAEYHLNILKQIRYVVYKQ